MVIELTREEYMNMYKKITELRNRGIPIYAIAEELQLSIHKVLSIIEGYHYNVGNLKSNEVLNLIDICSQQDPLAWGTIVARILKQNNILTISQFNRYSVGQLLDLRGIGPKYVQILIRVKNYIANSGLYTVEP